MNLKKDLKKAVLAGALLFGGPALADVIVLHDGSRIQGEVLSMSNGQYQIRTDSLGVVTVSKSKIRAIESGSGFSQPVPSMSDSAGSNIESLQSRLAGDQGVMSMILQLQSDPDMQAVLSDPELMRAVQSFDLQTLQSHPKILKLMQNDKVQSIHNKVN